MKKKELSPGTLVQVNPRYYPEFNGNILFVTHCDDEFIYGYFRTLRETPLHVEVEYDAVEEVGKAAWDIDDGSHESKWHPLGRTYPDLRDPCEYIIEVHCKGWYYPKEESHFFSDPREAPTAKIVRWAPWEDGERYEIGMENIKNYYNLIKEPECTK